MAIGITGFGVHIPRYRLSRSLVAKAWGTAFGPGDRAVASFDEDAITMAVSAVDSALRETDLATPDSIYFASTSAPYQEKQSSTLIATVTGLDRTASTSDVTGSLRAGTSALKSALDSVKAGSSTSSVVVSSEIRSGEPGTDAEQVSGDAAVALIIGSDKVLATFEGVYSISEEFTDSWRVENQPNSEKGDTAFVTAYGYQRIVRDALKGALKKFGLTGADVARVAVAAPDRRSYAAVLGAAGFVAGSYPDDPLLSTVGDTGASAAPLLLVKVLEDAKPGDNIIVAAYGSGNCDVLWFKATDLIDTASKLRNVSKEVAAGRPLENYERFLSFRNVIEQEPLSPYSSLAMLWKEQKQDLRLLATKCKACGSVSFPRQRVCRQCRSLDNYEDFALGRYGTVYTWTSDHLFPNPDPPTAMVVADLDGGGRFYGQMTDAPAKLAKIGLKVELTFRRLHEGGGYHNYFWKLRPIVDQDA